MRKSVECSVVRREARTFVDRVKELCKDTTPMSQVLLHRLNSLEQEIDNQYKCRGDISVGYVKDELLAMELIRKYKAQLYSEGFNEY